MWKRAWDLDWSNAQVLYTLLLLPVAGAVYRWLRAKSSLESHYRDQRAMTTAGLASNEVIPRLARIIAMLPSPPGRLSTRPWRPGDESEIEDHLQSVRFGRMVDEVTPFFAATEDCRRCQEQIQKWLKGQALGFLAYLPGALFITWGVLQQSYEIPPTGYWLAVCDCLVGLTVAAVFFGFELASRNQLAALSMKYGKNQLT